MMFYGGERLEVLQLLAFIAWIFEESETGWKCYTEFKMVSAKGGSLGAMERGEFHSRAWFRYRGNNSISATSHC
ncbi:hypothetical protein GCM10008014_15270 [Paenibacillus silvae]|uniref:Uncharacterized protein n=1 Tax=Paenibacillus silvae TaxID=1325358 RepID=A0ABQ1Z5D4_9BACL|nr:hypothetical protein GCM10008014_15270 [Paenibacillus silvae]